MSQNRLQRETLTPLVPHGDEKWYDIVNTVMAIHIYAKVYGVASDSLPMQATGNAAVNRLFGLEEAFGQEGLELPLNVAQDVIHAVGNYGVIYQRHFRAPRLGTAGHPEGPLGRGTLHRPPQGRPDLHPAAAIDPLSAALS